ncbi:MAG: hypothetical protein SFU57_10385 [Gemmatimonadales bacterium]|nr:hypothetical protein [Gemmatimonadales bacterium]
MPSSRCRFEYLYRDASNYKAWGSVLLDGQATSATEAAIRARLIDGTWFVAERIGVPTLYRLVWGATGPDEDEDHVWHEFVGLVATGQEEGEPLMTVSELVDRLGRADSPSDER